MRRTLALFAGICLQAATSIAAETAENAKPLNLELVFDSSGSMAAAAGATTKIVAARQATHNVIDSLPDASAGLQVGFRVFGHAGDNTESGKAESCRSTELTAPLAGVDKSELGRQADAYSPRGWTPVTLALTEAAKDFPAASDGRNVIVLVSDGEETCGGDPCAAARALAASGAKVVTHVVGFGMTPKEASTLRCITEATGGVYLDAKDGNALAGALLGLVGEEVRMSGRLFEVSEDIVARVRIPKIELEGVRVEGGVVGLPGVQIGADGSVKVEGSGGADVDLGGILVGGRVPTGFERIECNPGEDCACRSNRNCELYCKGGGCELSAGSGSNAQMFCTDGQCKVSCGSGANCQIHCPKGNCEIRCGSGSVCQIDCPPGDCKVRCSSGALCSES